MKVGILGSGDVGQTLAAAFTQEGYSVLMGTRNPEKKEIKEFKKDNPAIEVGSYADSAAFGDLLVLAIPGSATDEVIKAAGKNNFKGKVVIDVSNPISKEPPKDGVLRFFTGPGDSLMERTQKALPEASLVKAFNSAGNTLMYKPKFKEGKPTMFICGDDDRAKRLVTEILTAFGWETEDMGKSGAAGAIESLCILWCIPGFLRNQWSHAFKLLKPS
ncbi:MAG TPA: NAD(P)-binding domain-containing protein [Puia sp.]|nr:NAD(P)-binding domain-containing protein [Puia sp.]